MSGKRVLMLLENNPYPQDTRVSQEARALTAAGYQVSVIAPQSPPQRWVETVEGVRVYRYPPPPTGEGFVGYLLEYGYSMLAALALSVVVLRREGFEVVHAHNPPDTFVIIGGLYKLLGRKFVFDHHDLSPEMYEARFGGESNGLVRRALLFFERLTYRVADHVIVTNESYKRVAMRRGGAPEKRVTIVRNGPDLSRLPRAEPDVELREGRHTVIAYVGQMGPQDGVDYLLRAIRHLVYDLGRKDVLAVLIGDGDAADSLRALAKELNIEPYVRFTGWLGRQDVMRSLAAADICAVPDPSSPYNDRSTMIKIMEYMVNRKPIVAFDMPEHRFSAGESAVYVPPNDEMKFSCAVAELMDDPEHRQRMGEIGRQRVESMLAWQYSVPKLLQAYRTLFGGSAGTDLEIQTT